MRATMLAICLVLVPLACASMSPTGDEYYESKAAKQKSAESLAETIPSANAAPKAPAGRILIKTGVMEITVLNAARALAAVGELLAKHEGFEAGRQSYASVPEREILSASEIHSITLTLKIPARKFETFIAETKELGSYTSEETSTEDVTFQYVDLEARLDSNRAVEKRLLAHLNNAVDIKGIVQVEKELARVREKIESLTAQFKVLKDQVSFSTLTLHISVRPDWIPPHERTLWEDISETFGDSIQALGTTARGFLVFGLAFLPWLFVFAIVGVAIVFPVRRWRRKKK
jgi:hypothetical protein